MTSITTRAGKGTPLTHTEVDDNFTNLNADKLEASNNLSDVSSASAARTNLGLGTAATTASTDYATAAQGALADSAVQPNDSPTFGSVTVSGTVDGRDVAADGSKLDGIEAGANVTDTANVTAAGALMDSEVTNLAQVKAFDSTDYATAAQGSLADSALQSGDNVSALTNDAGYTTNVGDITGVTAGSGISGGGTSGTVTINHADTSSQGSVNNSGATVIQDITLDTYGHITALGSTTLSIPAAYTNSNVDTHLNTGTATTDQVLAWTGSDYDWVDVGGGNPASTVIYVAQNTAPTGYLKANGAAISRTTYADLFAAIGTTFGAGDGSTTFNIPDLRGEFIRAWDDARGVDSGRSFGSAQATRVNNVQTVTSASGYDVYSGSISVDDSGSTTSRIYTGGGSGNSWSLRFAKKGGDTYPRNIALLACIKY